MPAEQVVGAVGVLAGQKRKKNAPPPGVEYAWREGARQSLDAQVVGEELARIAEKADADLPQLSPQVIVDEATPEDSPIHDGFEWNNEVAANNWRCSEARSMVRSIRTVSNGEVQAAPVWVAVTIPETNQRAYVETVKAWDQEAMRQQVLADAMKQLRGLAARYRNLEALSGVVAEIDRLPDAV